MFIIKKKKIHGLKWLLSQNIESVMRHLPVMLRHVIGDIFIIDKTTFKPRVVVVISTMQNRYKLTFNNICCDV